MGKIDRSIIVLVTVAGFLVAWFVAAGHAQQSPATIKNLDEQKPPPKAKKPPASLRSQRLGLELIADFTVTPLTYTGPCPATFIFKGTILSNKAITINYRLVRSNNTRTLPVPLTFEGPGKKEIIDIWNIDDTEPGKEFGGWEAIQVLWPMKMESNVAYFKGICSGEKKPETGQQEKEQELKSTQKYVFIGQEADPHTPAQKSPYIPIPGSDPVLPAGQQPGPVPSGGPQADPVPAPATDLKRGFPTVQPSPVPSGPPVSMTVQPGLVSPTGPGDGPKPGLPPPGSIPTQPGLSVPIPGTPPPPQVPQGEPGK